MINDRGKPLTLRASRISGQPGNHRPAHQITKQKWGWHSRFSDLTPFRKKYGNVMYEQHLSSVIVHPLSNLISFWNPVSCTYSYPHKSPKCSCCLFAFFLKPTKKTSWWFQPIWKILVKFFTPWCGPFAPQRLMHFLWHEPNVSLQERCRGKY